MKPITYNFVGNSGSGDDLDMLRKLEWKDGTTACMMHAWVWSLFSQLRDLGLPVSFSYKLEQGAVNFIHGEVARYQLTAAEIRTYFIVGLRADFRAFPYSSIEVVQNKLSQKGRSYYLPHFPQPGLVHRNAARKEVVHICFSGQLENLGLDAEVLQKDLSQMGCRFVHKNVGEWHDLSDVDVLLGFRALSKERFDTKPATKLFNAWLAGIPFIGGYDSAFEQVGVPGEDFIRISAYEELLESILRLKNDPGYYDRLVRAGRVSAQRYGVEHITDQWVSFLEQTVEPEYRRWQSDQIAGRFRRIVAAAAFAVWEQGIRNYRRAKEWK